MESRGSMFVTELDLNTASPVIELVFGLLHWF